MNSATILQLFDSNLNLAYLSNFRLPDNHVGHKVSEDTRQNAAKPKGKTSLFDDSKNIRLNPQCDVIKATDETLIFLVDNSKLLFKYKNVQKIVDHILNPLKKGLSRSAFLEGEDLKMLAAQWNQLIQSFIELKIILEYSEKQDLKKCHIFSNLFDSQGLLNLLKKGNAAEFSSSSWEESNLKQSAEDFSIVISRLSERPQLKKVNSYFKKMNKPWLWVEYEGLHVQFGPLFNLDGSSCLECLLIREKTRSENQLILNYISSVSSQLIIQSQDFFGNEGLLNEFLAEKITRLIAESSFNLYSNELTSINFKTLKSSQNKFIQSPICNACFPDE